MNAHLAELLAWLPLLWLATALTAALWAACIAGWLLFTEPAVRMD